MRKTGLFLLMTATLILSGVFLACSNDGDSENESQKTEYTVTLYTEFGANPTTAKVESGKSLGQNMTPTKDGYDFKGWFSADGTDYTGKAITGNVTLFAYFIKTTTEGAGTATVTTTTNEVGADSYQSEKTVAVTTNENGTKVTVTTESSSKTNADGSKTETESKTTENFDGTNTTVTSEKTVTTKNADGKTTSKVETTVAADGTTTITTTDKDGNTTTETTGGSGEKLEVTLNETGYPAFEIAIPQDDDICIETLSISVYRKKNGDTGYSKILDVWQNRKDSFEKNPTYEFTDWDVAKDASYSYYYQISGEDNNGEFTKTSGKSDFVAISNGKFGELTASVSGGNVTYNEKTGVLTLDTLPTISSEFSFMLKMKNLDYGYLIRQAGKNYQTKGDTIDLFKSNKGKTLIPYWYVYYYKSDDYLREYWYPVVSEFYGTDYGLPESITVPETVSDGGDTGNTTLSGTTYKSTMLTMNGSAAPSGVSETISFAADGTCTLTGYYNAVGTYSLSGTALTINFTSGDILGTMTGTLSDSNATITAQGTVTVSGSSVVLYGVYAKQEGNEENQSSEAVSANSDGTYTVTPYNIAATLSAIAENGDKEATLIVTGATNDLMEKIPAALNATTTVLVNLDLSQSTKVTSLGEKRFKSCITLKTIKLSDTVYLDEKCFQDCTSLTSIDIPEAEIEIPSRCFSGCTSLTTVTISKNVNSVHRSAFSGCTALSEITIPENVTSFFDDAFYECTNLTTVSFTGTFADWCKIYFASEKANPVYYAKSVKINGETLTSAVIPETITEIKGYTFYNWQSLTSVTIHDSVTKIGNYAFYGCSELTALNIPTSVVSIGSNAFSKCSSLSGTIEIPSGITNITYGLFSSCVKITEIKIPDSVTKIENYAFSGCSSLKTITIPDGVQSIGDYAFQYCASLEGIEIPDGITEISWNMFSNCTKLTSVNIPNSVTTIMPYAFSGIGITTLTIPDSVTTIGAYAFMSCTALKIITLSNSLTAISGYLFHDCTALESIEIPNSVTKIYDRAFSRCYKMTNVVLSENLTSIGSLAFYDCSSLTSITIPAGVTSIGSNAFSGHNSSISMKLTSATFADPESTWYSTSSSSYTNGTEIGSMSATDTAENATKLKSTYAASYLYNSNYTAE